MDRVSDKVKSALAMASMGWGGNEDVLARAVDDMVVVISRRSERYPNQDDLQAMLVSVSAIMGLACTLWPCLQHAHHSQRMEGAGCDSFLCPPLSLFTSQYFSLFLYIYPSYCISPSFLSIPSSICISVLFCLFRFLSLILLHAIVTKKGDARMALMLFFFHVARSSSTSWWMKWVPWT